MICADIVVISCANNELSAFSIHLQSILVRNLGRECSNCSSSTVSDIASTKACTDKIDICRHVNCYVWVSNHVNLVFNYNVLSSPSLRASRVTLKLSWMHVLLVFIKLPPDLLWFQASVFTGSDFCYKPIIWIHLSLKSRNLADN